MRKSNFALISALYDSKSGGLYADVYFPIIKYTIVSLFYQEEHQEFYTQKNVSDFIKENFGIEIPSLVIKKAIVAVNSKSPEFELDIYENGAEFKILRAWDFSINEDIDAKAHLFDTHIDNLESEYRKYVQSEGIESNKTFLDFISDNTEDILGYFENESVERIDTEYAVMAYFLNHLHTTSPELYKIANELFWGSIIAGFLKREHVADISCGGNATEYFLDTPIVMGLLKLSTDETETYSKEVLDIIIASGGVPKIHPITLDEVKSIISSVEKMEIPIPNTPIEAAWIRDKLTKSKLAKKRVDADSDLEGLGAIHFPPFSQQNINSIIKAYTNKVDVKDLTKARGGISNDRGIFRDIHDIFMDDYIEERRKKKGADDCCFFVTTNSDLVKFCSERKLDSRMRTISASKIVLELWMHNTKQSGLENNALVEMIARCININSRDVRNKLGIVAKYYNESKREDFDIKLFQEITKCLYKRDKDMIAAVEGLKDGEDINIDVNMRVIIEKARESSKNTLNQLSDIQKQVEKLQDMLEAAEQEKRAALATGQEEVKKTKELNEKLTESIETTRKQGKVLEKYAEKDRLSDQRDQLEKELEKMEASKKEYIKKHDHYMLYYRLELCMIILLILSVIVGVYQVISGKEFTVTVIVAFLSLLMPLFTFATRRTLYVIERQALHDEIQLKLSSNWEAANPEHSSKKSQMEVIQEKITELENIILEELRWQRTGTEV